MSRAGSQFGAIAFALACLASACRSDRKKADIRAEETTASTPSSPKKTIVVSPEKPRGGAMVKIPGGTFKMGYEPEPEGFSPVLRSSKPVHDVTVATFQMDETEVTVASYTECVKAGACSPDVTSIRWVDVTEKDKKHYNPTCNYGKAGRDNHPINCVDWNQATAFCAWVGKRLPTEEEWEYAARGGEMLRLYPWGTEEPEVTHLNVCRFECVTWLKEHGVETDSFFAHRPGPTGWEPGSPRVYDAWPTTAPVKSFEAGKSKDGLYDLAGNVWEWTSSGWSEDYSKKRTDERRVIRGGGWSSTTDSDVCGADRRSNPIADPSHDIGVRCARSVP